MKTLLLMIVWVLFFFNSYSQILVGATTEGGPDGNGEIFKYDVGVDEFEVVFSPQLYNGPLHSFTNINNGKVICCGYKTVSPDSAKGVVLEYSPYNQLLNVLFELPDIYPGSIYYDSANDAIYGIASNSINKYSVLFRYGLSTSEYDVLFEFTDSLGWYPSGDIILTTEGVIYGTTRQGGLYNDGVIYGYDIDDDEYSILFNFYDTLGAYPMEGVMMANNGKLYGTTHLGGEDFDSGVLFEFDIEQAVYKVIVNFSDSLGRESYCLPVDVGNGKLYGLTYEGGINHYGVIFEYDYINDIYSIKHHFDESLGWPVGSLNELEDGVLYGAANTSVYGAIFKYSIYSDTFEEISQLNCDIGSFPSGEFHKCENGEVISSTSRRSTSNYGSLFELDLITNEIKKVFAYKGYSTFHNIKGTPTFKDESIYCLLKSDYWGWGNDFYSTLLSFEKDSMKYKVNDAFQGAVGSLSLFNKRLFYYSSGWDNYEIRVFDIDQGKVVSTLSGYGTGHFTLGDDGKLYGMRAASGDFPFRIFKLDPVSYSYETVFTHYGPNKPEPFENSFTHLSNGKLLGLTSNSGGADTSGLIFEFDIYDKEYVELYDFSNSTANVPTGELIEYEEGVYYGLSQFGGDNGFGTIYTFLQSLNDVEIAYSFNGLDGANPTGSLKLASDGKFYGLTTNGGVSGIGVVFRFDPATGEYNKILDFTGENGSHPQYSALIEICDEPVILSDPQDVEAVEGDTVMFVVSAESDDLTGYQWYQYTNPVIGATNDTLIITGVSSGDEGDYYCEVMATCMSVKSETATLTLTSGINIAGYGCKIYPNPVNNILTINPGKHFDILSVKIVNLQGQVVDSQTFIEKSRADIDVSGLKNGVYFLQIFLDDTVVNTKFVKF